ncbi:MAG: hypothetical protein KKE43_02300, partial [Actinobacteria bacterium]|nr:hypothetical protein [Actinomycetota bacterium]
MPRLTGTFNPVVSGSLSSSGWKACRVFTGRPCRDHQGGVTVAKTYEEINQRIRKGEAVVLTAEEMT